MREQRTPLSNDLALKELSEKGAIRCYNATGGEMGIGLFAGYRLASEVWGCSKEGDGETKNQLLITPH